MKRDVLWWLGFVWSLPNTAVGYLFALALARSCPKATSAYWPYPRVAICRDGSVLQRCWMSMRILGASCGAVVVVRDGDSFTERTLKHESRHTAQSFVFGPFFGPAYVLAGLWAVIVRGENFYYANAFEIDARRAAERP